MQDWRSLCYPWGQSGKFFPLCLLPVCMVWNFSFDFCPGPHVSGKPAMPGSYPVRCIEWPVRSICSVSVCFVRHCLSPSYLKPRPESQMGLRSSVVLLISPQSTWLPASSCRGGDKPAVLYFKWTCYKQHLVQLLDSWKANLLLFSCAVGMGGQQLQNKNMRKCRLGEIFWLILKATNRRGSMELLHLHAGKSSMQRPALHKQTSLLFITCSLHGPVTGRSSKIW